MAKTQTTPCFDERALKDYLEEKLAEKAEAGVQEHLNGCENCQRLLEQVAADRTMWDCLRQHMSFSRIPDMDVVDDERLESLVEFLAPTDDPNMLGRLGVYEICGLIGQGSTGIVLKALEPRLNRYVAIKVLSPLYSNNGAARKRFEREGRAVAAVIHQNVVPIFAVDEFRGLPYIVMQYIPGISLLQRIEKKGPLDTCEVTRIGLQIAKGLAAAHHQGIIHRDVKPANVILENSVDRAMVTDFGLARVADEATMTRSGTIAGTPQYMSPEQARGDAIDPRSDLFSLGSLMYAACTARPPFRAETLVGVINRVCHAEPRPIRESNPAIEPWLCDVIDRLISKIPDQRFQSADEVAAVLAGELAHLQNPTTHKKPSRDWRLAKSKSKPILGIRAWGIAVALLALGCAGLLATDYGKQLTSWMVAKSTHQEKNGDANKSSDRETARPKANSQKMVEPESNENGIPVSLTAVNPFESIDPNSVPESTPLSESENESSPEVTWTRNQGDWNTDAVGTFDQKLEQAFKVEPEGSFVLDADKGKVLLRASELDNQINVTVMRRVEAASQSEADKILKNHQVQMSRTDDGFRLEGERIEDSAVNSKITKILYRVSIPKAYAPRISVLEGDVIVGDFENDVAVKTNYGAIRVGRTTGNLNVEGRGGCMDLTAGCTGKAEVLCINGDAYLSNVDAKSRVRMSGGNILLGENAGEVYAQTSGGDIKIKNVLGKVTAFALDGNVVANLDESPKSDCKLGATNGDLSIRLMSTVAAKVELPWNEIEGFQPTDPSDVELTERVFNEGEKMIQGSCDSGSIHFEIVEMTPGQSKPHEGLGGSGIGLGGSGGLSPSTRENFLAARQKMSEEPKAGSITNFEFDGDENVDGYSLYLPVSFDKSDENYPILVSLGGAWTVGGPIDSVNNWGLSRLIRDESDLSIERNRLILDSFVVVCPHILSGQYSNHPESIKKIIETVAKDFRGDLNRVYVTGLSRGGHGTWGLASKLPDFFAAIVPVAGSTDFAEDLNSISKHAIWIAHNTGDGSYSGADQVAGKIEKIADEKFLRVDSPDVSNTDFLEKRFVFTAPKRDHHDAWTELYSRSEVYQWLLKQSR